MFLMVKSLTYAGWFLMLIGFMTISSGTASSSLMSSTSNRKRSRTQSKISSPQPCAGAVIPSSRRACGFFLWDLPSAILYKWCHHLLKDNIYEGRGGFLFVRYESNSILQLLYPCSRYSPNKCMICGGSAPDHLELWWSKHNLYSPFDQYLDKTYHDALMIDDEDVVHAVSTDVGDASSVNRKRGRFRNKSPPSIRTTPTIMTGPPSFAFHKRYVEDVSDIVNGVNDPKEQINLIKKKLTSLQSGMNYRIKRAPVTGVTYLSPGINRRRNDKKNYTKKDTFIDMLSIIALGRIEDLILDQAIEFEHRRRRHSRLGNRF